MKPTHCLHNGCETVDVPIVEWDPVKVAAKVGDALVAPALFRKQTAGESLKIDPLIAAVQLNGAELGVANQSSTVNEYDVRDCECCLTGRNRRSCNLR